MIEANPAIISLVPAGTTWINSAIAIPDRTEVRIATTTPQRTVLAPLPLPVLIR
jgi:hypothetical protein